MVSAQPDLRTCRATGDRPTAPAASAHLIVPFVTITYSLAGRRFFQRGRLRAKLGMEERPADRTSQLSATAHGPRGDLSRHESIKGPPERPAQRNKRSGNGVRDGVENRRHMPHRLRTMSPTALREPSSVSLGDPIAVVREFSNPNVSRLGTARRPCKR